MTSLTQDSSTHPANESNRINKRWSIKVRVALFSLTVFLVAIWALALFASHLLRKDIEQLLSEQQFSMATMLATDIDNEIHSRLNDLTTIAQNIAPDLANPANDLTNVQNRLNALPIFQRQFNGGVFAVKINGQRTDSGPNDLSQRLADPAIASALSGKPTIGTAHAAANTALFNLAVPVRNNQGAIIGALVGTTLLSQTNFLDHINQGRFGRSGGFLVVSPRARVIVAASDKRRILEPSPPPGRHPVIDRFLAGDEGSALLTNPRGVEVLQSVKRLSTTDWYVAVAMPSTEVFAPIQNLQRHTISAALLLSLIAGCLTWWMLRRQLLPTKMTLDMLDTLETLPNLTSTQGELKLQPLPVTGNDEIGQLVGGFNRLLQLLSERDAALRLSTSLLSEAQRIAHLGSWEHDVTSNTLRWSDEMYRLLELSPLSARPSFDIFFAIVHPEDRLLAQQRFIETISQREPYDLTHRLQMPDGRIKWVKVCCNTDFDKNGRALRSVGIAQDITNQKLTDDALHLTQQQLRSIIDNMPAMVFMKRANDLRFELFNRAGEELLGYRAEQLIGKNDRDFFSPEQADFFEMQDRRVLESNEAVEIKEEAIRTASGATLTLHTRKVALRDAQGTATHLLGISVDISEHKRSAERINQLAYYDQLTGLPNRTLLLDRLRLALATCHRNNTHGALLFLDLDKFKTLNDTQGHDKGDLLLQQVAERLTSCVRGCDTVARLGGDEFVVMLSDLSINAQDAGCQTEAIGEKLLMALSQPYQFGNFVHRCTASIGVAMFDNQRSDIDVLLKQADLAMYKAKAAGRNSLRFFDPHLETDIQRRAALERDLHDAIHGGHFSLHYQAQMCDGTLTGSEALIRWDHPQRGMVPPAEFIPLAEETGLILPLGAWVLETACRQLAEWSRNPELSRLTIAVNVSAQQFRKPDFVGQVDTVLRATGANPQRLKLELTESLLIEDIDNVIDKMHALKAIGVGFALDDFGTGYSSLYYLKRLPLDQLKIDQSFIRDILDDPNDAAIARTIVALARNLGLMVLAEGVETEAQFDFLSEIDCHAHQGYYFSQPLPARHFEEFALHL